MQCKITEAATKYYKTTAFVAGWLSVGIFAPYFQQWCGFLAFGWLLRLLLSTQSIKRAAAIGYWFGFAHFAGGFSWVGNALLVDADRFGWLYPIALVAAGGFFGAFAAVPAAVCAMLQDKWNKWLAFGAVWVLGEWGRSFILTGFPWNLLGYSWANEIWFLQSAAVGGAYLVSLSAVLGYSLVGIWMADCRRRILLQVMLGMAIIFGGNYLWGQIRLRGAEDLQGETRVRIVQPSIPQTMKWSKQAAEDNWQKYLQLSASKTDEAPQAIVWGETASPFGLEDDEVHLHELAEILPKQAILLTGVVSYQYNDGRYRPHNSMVMIDGEGQIRGYYHKAHLVPFGEYVPLRKYLPEFVRPVANAIGEFGRGQGAESFELVGLPKMGAAICYEIIFPHQVVDEKNRPEWLVNLTNDGWYGVSSGPYQHWVAAKFRAVEEGITIVRAANNGISGMIDAYGREKGVMPLNYVGISDVNLSKSIGGTTYGRLGNLISITLCLILLAVGVIREKIKLK